MVILSITLSKLNPLKIKNQQVTGIIFQILEPLIEEKTIAHTTNYFIK